jgi:hypothetical protein
MSRYILTGQLYPTIDLPIGDSGRGGYGLTSLLRTETFCLMCQDQTLEPQHAEFAECEDRRRWQERFALP